MSDFKQLADLIGILDAVLVVAIVFVWRAWRQTESEKYQIMEKHLEAQAKVIGDYGQFKHILEQLCARIQGGS